MKIIPVLKKRGEFRFPCHCPSSMTLFLASFGEGTSFENISSVFVNPTNKESFCCLIKFECKSCKEPFPKEILLDNQVLICGNQFIHFREKNLFLVAVEMQIW